MESPDRPAEQQQLEIEREIKQLNAQLDEFEDDILRLEEQCEETIGMIHEAERRLARVLRQQASTAGASSNDRSTSVPSAATASPAATA